MRVNVWEMLSVRHITLGYGCTQCGLPASGAVLLPVLSKEEGREAGLESESDA